MGNSSRWTRPAGGEHGPAHRAGFWPGMSGRLGRRDGPRSEGPGRATRGRDDHRRDGPGPARPRVTGPAIGPGGVGFSLVPVGLSTPSRAPAGANG